ncbi:TPA: YadA-like family protein, partial [Neisseria gonorrhoeae]
YRPKKYAVALGSSSTASGEYSYASGYNSVASGNKSYAAGYASVASAEGSVVIGDSRQVKPEADQGVAVGSEAKVNAERGIAIGKEAKAGGKTTNTLLDGPAYYADAIAVGYQAEAGKGGAIALGKQAKATKQNGMALGVESEAAGDFSTAVGNESKAKGQGGVGLGNQSKAEADFAVAVGNKAEATKENSLVIGRYARANGNHSVSLGSRSEIKDGVSNSVAPGYGSVASENNVVSVAYKETPQSTELSYRKIVGVDDGVNDFDAVNVRQSKAMQGQNMAELFSVRSEVRGVAASSAALSALTPLSYDANNPTQFMVGFGTYKGRQAMALGLSHFVNDRFMVKVGGTLGGNKTGHMMNVGLTWKFGTSQGVPATSDKVLMEQLMQDNRQLKPRLEKLEARLNAM